jgi:energy-coupling factor transporter ATP-binding protein EcfA2
LSGSPIIAVRDLTVSYPDGREAIRGVTFSIEHGESVAILGANGAGKSTLLLALVGVLRGSGEIIVDSSRLSDKTLACIRRSAQIVFQDPNDQLFMPVLRDDIAFGPLNFGVPREKIEALVARSLEMVGLAGFEERSPLDMSAGERRRAALATVLACSPRILLLDEPTSNLDIRGKRELAAALNQIACTKLIATHDLKFACQVCSRAVVLVEGRAVFQGDMDMLLGDTELLDSGGLR